MQTGDVKEITNEGVSMQIKLIDSQSEGYRDIQATKLLQIIC
jgi:hypothetical protein